MVQWIDSKGVRLRQRGVENKGNFGGVVLRNKKNIINYYVEQKNNIEEKADLGVGR